MAVLVRDGFRIESSRVRTFQKLLWADLPDGLKPVDPNSGQPWYSDSEWAEFRLASKSFWDVPVVMAGGAVVHILVSHPTPPAFDGPERRNQMRNHDEIRFWSDYLDGAAYLVDDSGAPGGLDARSPFVIVGDLNADPDEGRSIDAPIQRFLLDHPRVRGELVPVAPGGATRIGDRTLDADDTAAWGMRVDYVLPSTEFEIRGGAVVRPDLSDLDTASVSDHFLVYLDLTLVPTQD